MLGPTLPLDQDSPIEALHKKQRQEVMDEYEEIRGVSRAMNKIWAEEHVNKQECDMCGRSLYIRFCFRFCGPCAVTMWHEGPGRKIKLI